MYLIRRRLADGTLNVAYLVRWDNCMAVMPWDAVKADRDECGECDHWKCRSGCHHVGKGCSGCHHVGKGDIGRHREEDES